MKKWVCQVCGYIYEGDTAPEECPVCHVGAEKFEELKGEMDPEKRKDLIFQMQQILVDDAAVLIDGYYNSSMIYSKKVGSAHIHTADYYWLSTEITPAE